MEPTDAPEPDSTPPPADPPPPPPPDAPPDARHEPEVVQPSNIGVTSFKAGTPPKPIHADEGGPPDRGRDE